MNSQNVRQGLLVVIAALAVVIVALLALPAGAAMDMDPEEAGLERR